MTAGPPGDRIPFVKNTRFATSALPTHARDLDIISMDMEIATYFATHHGDRIMADVGIDPRKMKVDADMLRQNMGRPQGTDRFTARDLQERRDLIMRRMRGRRSARARVT